MNSAEYYFINILFYHFAVLEIFVKRLGFWLLWHMTLWHDIIHTGLTGLTQACTSKGLIADSIHFKFLTLLYYTV